MIFVLMEKGEKMKLIDADKLEPSEVYMNYGFTRIVYMDDIDEMPTVDAVKVVRCGECKYYRNGGCLTGRYDLKDTDFCSLGERNDEID